MDTKYYRLTCDVTNPKADRRYKNNPIAQAVWPKGMKISVEVLSASYSLREVKGIKFPDTRFSYHTIMEMDPRFDLIMASVEEVEEEFKDYAERTEVQFFALKILERLVRDGKVTKRELEGYVEVLNAEYEEEDRLHHEKYLAECAAKKAASEAAEGA